MAGFCYILIIFAQFCIILQFFWRIGRGGTPPEFNYFSGPGRGGTGSSIELASVIIILCLLGFVETCGQYRGRFGHRKNEHRIQRHSRRSQSRFGDPAAWGAGAACCARGFGSSAGAEADCALPPSQEMRRTSTELGAGQILQIREILLNNLEQRFHPS